MGKKKILNTSLKTHYTHHWLPIVPICLKHWSVLFKTFGPKRIQAQNQNRNNFFLPQKKCWIFTRIPILNVPRKVIVKVFLNFLTSCFFETSWIKLIRNLFGSLRWYDDALMNFLSIFWKRAWPRIAAINFNVISILLYFQIRDYCWY